MKELNNLTHSEMLTLLMDGELPETQETALFAAMAENDALRDELRELLAIRESVRQDTEAFTPPAESAGAVFSQLGLNHPSYTGPAAAAGATAGTAISNIFRRAWAPALALLIGVMGTALVITDSEQEITQNQTSAIPVVQSTETETSDISSALQNNETTETTENTGSNTVVSAKSDNNTQASIAANDTQQEDNINAVPEKETASMMFREVSNSNLAAADNFSGQGLSRFADPAFVKAGGFSLTPARPVEETDFSLFTRGISNFNAAGNYGFAAGVYFGHIGNVRIGAEAGQLAIYAPSLNSGAESEVLFGSFVFHYNINSLSISENFYPYAQLSLGGTEFGPLGNMMLGLQYDLTSFLSINAGLDGNLIYYNRSVGPSEIINNYGITGGLIFNF